VVGRAARAASITQALTDLFGDRVRTAPDHIVALGAAAEAAILSGNSKNKLLLDSLAHTLRVQLAAGHSTPVIVRHTTIPTRKEVCLIRRQTDQPRVLIRIIAGESLWAERNAPLAELSILCTNDHKDSSELWLSLDIDADCSLGILVKDSNGKKLAKT